MSGLYGLIEGGRGKGDVWEGAGQGSGLGQDKRTGTCGSHVIDGVEVFQEPGQSGRFLVTWIFHIYQWVERDLLVGATR